MQTFDALDRLGQARPEGICNKGLFQVNLSVPVGRKSWHHRESLWLLSLGCGQCLMYRSGLGMSSWPCNDKAPGHMTTRHNCLVVGSQGMQASLVLCAGNARRCLRKGVYHLGNCKQDAGQLALLKSMSHGMTVAWADHAQPRQRFQSNAPHLLEDSLACLSLHYPLDNFQYPSSNQLDSALSCSTSSSLAACWTVLMNDLHFSPRR